MVGGLMSANGSGCASVNGSTPRIEPSAVPRSTGRSGVRARRRWAATSSSPMSALKSSSESGAIYVPDANAVVWNPDLDAAARWRSAR